MMAIDWQTIRPALLDLFNDLSGLQTVWQDKRRPFIDTSEQAITLLRVRSVEGIGVDDQRYVDQGTLAPPTPELEEQAAGHRRVSLDVRVESFRHDDDRFAMNAVEDIRTKVRFGSSLARLRALNIALVRVSQAIDLPNVVADDRVTSVATLDLILNVGVCVADGDNHVQTIETVDNPFDHVDTVINPPC
jgi:hypothetical protein